MSVLLSLVKVIGLFTDSNIIRNGVLQQNRFLTNVIASCDKDGGVNVISNLHKVREIITEPSNVILYIAGNLDYLKNPARTLENFLPPELNHIGTAKK